MPSYAELQGESVWRTQFVPQALNEHLIVPLRNHYGLGPQSIGAPGDNNHLYGRHRSRNWCLYSAWCTNRSYGTSNARDQGGSGDWYRAIDVGITGQTLYDACRRLDTAVRAGQLPGVAEWFGTFDGRVVVGWYQGRPSSSDSSHLWHMHVGFWNESADDAALMRQVFGVITGQQEDAMANQYTLDNLDRWMSAVLGNTPTVTGIKDPAGKVVPPLPNVLHEILAAVKAGGGTPGAVDYDRIERDVRDAVADLGEGGADAVRADAE